MSLVGEFTKGVWRENPVLRLVLGLCPAEILGEHGRQHQTQSHAHTGACSALGVRGRFPLLFD